MRMTLSSEELGLLTVMAASAGLTFLVLSHRKLFQPKLSQDSSVKRGDRNFNYHQPASSRQRVARNLRDGKKRVRFAEDIADSSTGNGKNRKLHGVSVTKRIRRPAYEVRQKIEVCSSNPPPPAGGTSSKRMCGGIESDKKPGIPANRLALYKGILQYRSQRAASIYIDSLDE